MQLATIEIARNLAGLPEAASSEFSDYMASDDRGPLIGLMTEWVRGSVKERRSQESDLGGTMRLGAYDCTVQPNTLLHKIYDAKTQISERHRHRYEVNHLYMDDLCNVGAIFSGMSPSGQLPEVIELPDHPWFLAVQFHPEFKSRPFKPHPLFASFIEAAIAYSEQQTTPLKEVK